MAERNTREQGSPRRSLSQIIAYALPALPIATVVTPVSLYLPQLYAKETSVTLAMLGTVLLISRVFDGVTDQLVGYLSDITETQFGSRKPWMLAGCAVILSAAYFLFNPPPTVGFFYLLISMLGFYLGWTMVSVPHTAWGAELSEDYNERSRIGSIRGILSNVGNLSFTLMPIMLFAVVALPLTVVASLTAPVGDRRGNTRPSVRRFIAPLRANKPFWNYFGIFFLQGVANGMLYTLAFTFYGGALGFYLLAFWGFDVRPDIFNDSRAIFGLLTTYIVIPSLLFALLLFSCGAFRWTLGVTGLSALASNTALSKRC